MFNLVVHIKSKDNSNISELTYHLGEMAKRCPLEPGCIYYKVHKITEKTSDEKAKVSGEFLVVETWDSEESWKKHLLMDTYLIHYKNSILPLLDRDVYFLEEFEN